MIINSNLISIFNKNNKQSKYSNYKLGKIDIETEKAYLAFIDGFTDRTIWIPKSVVDPQTKLI